jgi:GNAT superfamily N-acetyltransferase
MASLDAQEEAGLLRRAEPGDVLLVLGLIRDFYRVDGHVFNESRLRPALEPLLDDDRFGVVWLIGQPVGGYAIVTWSYSLESGGREALLDEIYVADPGHGLGSAAMRAILDDVAARGVGKMFLETELRNARARDFYTRAGFDTDDSIWMSCDPGKRLR